eukprot:5348301-Amphidinium_carterae.1
MMGGICVFVGVSLPYIDGAKLSQKWLVRDASWFDEGVWTNWFTYQTQRDAGEYVSERQCIPLLPFNDTCATVSLPINQIQGRLGWPLGPGEHVSINNDVLYYYAYLFLFFGVGCTIGFLVHDWALIHATQKDYIWDWTGLNNGFPCLQYLWGLTACVGLCRCLKDNSKRRKMWLTLGIVMSPFVVLWNIVVLVVFLLPIMLFLFLRHPIRLSRFWIFLLLVNSSIYGIIMTIHEIAFIASDRYRPRYAVTWTVTALDGGVCECGCSFFMSKESLVNLLVIAVGVVIKSILSAFRCLKGLRRSQWANLMAVTFPIPVSAWSVYWTTPDGNPITHRSEGEPVQSEKAFDPFALMDEQPESKYTVVTLQPEFAYFEDEVLQRIYPKPFAAEQHTETIGKWKQICIDVYSTSQS